MFHPKTLADMSDSFFHILNSSECIYNYVTYIKTVAQVALLCQVLCANNLTSNAVFSLLFLCSCTTITIF